MIKAIFSCNLKDPAPFFENQSKCCAFGSVTPMKTLKQADFFWEKRVLLPEICYILELFHLYTLKF